MFGAGESTVFRPIRVCSVHPGSPEAAGNRTVKVLPSPSLLAVSTVPPWVWTMAWVMASPPGGALHCALYRLLKWSGLDRISVC